jgi:predicted AAA+ superfamily ATPase
MGGFTLDETGVDKWKRLWLRGGFPPSFLAGGGERSYSWRINFVQSFLERDIPLLGIRVPAPALRRFWTMLAHLHGQVWNAAELARAMGVKEDTARHYLDILTGAFMVRQLPPWFENTGKRLVKAPKVYFRDSGLLHALLGLKSIERLLSYPRFGFSWEGFAMETIIRYTKADRDAYFYRTHAGAELDLLLVRGVNRYGFEFKFEDRPRLMRSMHMVLGDLKLTKLWIIYSGDRSYRIGERIDVLPLADCWKAVTEAKT